MMPDLRRRHCAGGAGGRETAEWGTRKGLDSNEVLPAERRLSGKADHRVWGIIT